MLLPILFSLMFGFTATAAADKDLDQRPTPIMRTVEPAAAKAGAVVLVKGDYLSSQFVSEVYVSDGVRNLKVTITEQTDTALKFTVPANCKPGKYLLVVLINALDPVLLEEPVKLTVIE